MSDVCQGIKNGEQQFVSCFFVFALLTLGEKKDFDRQILICVWKDVSLDFSKPERTFLKVIVNVFVVVVIYMFIYLQMVGS